MYNIWKKTHKNIKSFCQETPSKGYITTQESHFGAVDNGSI